MSIDEYYLTNFGQLFHTETNCPICDAHKLAININNKTIDF
ncbi:hypothetical protein BH23PAT2_BH23PAT2_07660 [soil metagenome]